MSEKFVERTDQSALPC